MKEAMIDNKKRLGKDRTRTHYNNKFRSLSLKKICVCRFQGKKCFTNQDHSKSVILPKKKQYLIHYQLPTSHSSEK